MSELGDIMGEEFEEEYQEKANQRDEARKVNTEVMMEICYEALNNDGFKGEEPRFRFAGESVDHDVLLMESPDDDLQTFRWPLGDDAKTQGMFHLDELFSLAFQENMLDLLSKIETGEYYVVVGQYEERTEEQGDGTTETYYNINPVRGIVPLAVGKKYADKFEEQLESTSVEEQSEEQSNESSNGSGADIDLGDDSEPEVTDSDVMDIFKGLRSEAPQILEGVAEGDSDTMDKMVSVVNSNIQGSTDDEHIFNVFEENIESIPGRGEEDDSGIDLGGIDDTDEETSEETEEDEVIDESVDDETEDTDTSDEAEEASSEDSSDDSSDDEEDPSDWF